MRDKKTDFEVFRVKQNVSKKLAQIGAMCPDYGHSANRMGNKKPGLRRVVSVSQKCINAYAPSTFTACAKREILRDAVLRCTIPFCAMRAIMGSACFNASVAAFLSPLFKASSTLRMEVRS